MNEGLFIFTRNIPLRLWLDEKMRHYFQNEKETRRFGDWKPFFARLTSWNKAPCCIVLTWEDLNNGLEDLQQIRELTHCREAPIIVQVSTDLSPEQLTRLEELKILVWKVHETQTQGLITHLEHLAS
jgi:hypothetical protein